VPETDLDDAQKSTKKEKAKKPDQSSIPLEIEIVYNAQGPMSVAAKRAARDRLVHCLYLKSFIEVWFR